MGAQLAQAEAEAEAERSAHTQQLSRMRADRRVLSRTSKDFLEGKAAADRRRESIETQLAEAQAGLAAAEASARDRGRQLRGAGAAADRAEARASALEADMDSLRFELLRRDEAAEAAAEAARRDREVLVQCAKQLTAQVAAARGDAEAAAAQLAGARAEICGRVAAAEARAAEAELGRRAAEGYASDVEARLCNDAKAEEVATSDMRARLARGAAREAELEGEAEAARAEASGTRAALVEARAELRAAREGMEAARAEAEAGRLRLVAERSHVQLAAEELHREEGDEAEAERQRRRAGLDVRASLEAAAARAAARVAQLRDAHTAGMRQLVERTRQAEELLAGAAAMERERGAMVAALAARSTQQQVRDELLRDLGHRARASHAHVGAVRSVLAAELHTLERALGGASADVARLAAEVALERRALAERLAAESVAAAPGGVQASLLLAELRRADVGRAAASGEARSAAAAPWAVNAGTVNGGDSSRDGRRASRDGAGSDAWCTAGSPHTGRGLCTAGRVAELSRAGMAAARALEGTVAGLAGAIAGGAPVAAGAGDASICASGGAAVAARSPGCAVDRALPWAHSSSAAPSRQCGLPPACGPGAARGGGTAGKGLTAALTPVAPDAAAFEGWGPEVAPSSVGDGIVTSPPGTARVLPEAGAAQLLIEPHPVRLLAYDAQPPSGGTEQAGTRDVFGAAAPPPAVLTPATMQRPPASLPSTINQPSHRPTTQSGSPLYGACLRTTAGDIVGGGEGRGGGVSGGGVAGCAGGEAVGIVGSGDAHSSRRSSPGEKGRANIEPCVPAAPADAPGDAGGGAAAIAAAATLRASALAGGGLEWLQGDNYSLRLELLRLKYGKTPDTTGTGP